MTAYSDLIATKTNTDSIRAWVNDDIAPATTILTQAERWIYSKLRVREFLTTTSGTATASATTIDCPARYLAMHSFTFTSPEAFQPTRRTVEDLDSYRVYGSNGALEQSVPMDYSVAGTSIEFACANDKDRTFFMRFYQQPAPLSTSNETNYLTEKAPYLLRAACLIFANEHLKDDSEKNYWRQVAEAEIATLKEEDTMEAHGQVLMVQYNR